MNMKRLILPLCLSVLILALLILAGCEGEIATRTTEGGEEPEMQYEFLTGVELQTGETPILLLPSDTEQVKEEFTGDGTTNTFVLEEDGKKATEINSVKVNGKDVTDFNYDEKTGELELKEAPKEGDKVEVEYEVEADTPPVTSAPVETTPPTSTTPAWTGAPETPIIPYKPQTSENDD